MRVFHSTIATLGLAAIVATSVMTTGCEFTKKVIAKDKLNQGAIAYNGGKAKAAEQYFQEATDLIPTNSTAWLYYGSTIYKRFQGAVGDERKQLGDKSLEIFKKALDLSTDCKTRDSALGYLSNIYNDLDDVENNRSFMLKRAEGECADKAVRAVTYYSVGVKYWQCSYDQTTRYADKVNKDAFHYRNMDYPAAMPDKEKANKCTEEGLKYIEKSLAEDPEYVDALFYQGLLYREKQKLTKDEAQRKSHADMAQKIADKATALNKKKEEQKKAEEAAGAKQG